LATRQGDFVLWDLPGERQITSLPRIRTEGTSWVSTSPDGKCLCFVATNRLTVWSFETFEELATLPRLSPAPLPSKVCFANDSESIAVANEDCTVEVWNLARKERLGPWKAHRESMSGMAFMPGGEGLLTASHDTNLKLWDVKTQREVRHFGHTANTYTCVAVSPDGKRVAAASALNVYIGIWNAETGQEAARIKGFQGAEVDYLAFLADGNTLVSGTPEEVRLWRAPSWEEIVAAEKKTEAKTQ